MQHVVVELFRVTSEEGLNRVVLKRQKKNPVSLNLSYLFAVSLVDHHCVNLRRGQLAFI